MKKLIILALLILVFAVQAYAGTWLIMIDSKTYKEGTNNIGDVVEIYSNDAAPSGIGYESFNCIEIPDMTADQVRTVLQEQLPITKRAYKSSANADTWSFDAPTEAEFWQDGDDWKQITSQPKYQFRINDPDALVKSMTSATDLSTRGSALIDALTVNLTADEDNQIAVDALSTVTAIEKETEATK